MILEGVVCLGNTPTVDECVMQCAELSEDGCCFIEDEGETGFVCEFYYPLEAGPITTTTIDKDHVYASHCEAPFGAEPASFERRARTADVTEHSALYKALVHDASSD